MSETMTLTDGLVRLLSWRDDDDGVADRLLALHASVLAERLGLALARLRVDDIGQAKEIEALLDGLSDLAFQRILTAPRTCLILAGRASSGPGALAPYLREAILIERGEREGWDCLGQFHGGDAVRRVTLSNGIAVDHASPFALGSLPEVPGQSLGFEELALDLVLSRFSQAVDGISRVPIAARQLQRFVRSIMIRNDPTAGSLRSASSSLTVGLAVFRNPHLQNINREDLAEGLIHEMIHSLCDIVEFVEPFLTDPAGADKRVVSPWTSRSLDLNTYIQACFVWYGLWEFWFAAFDSGAFDSRNAVAYFQMSSRGLDCGIVGPVAPLSRYVSHSVIDGLATMEARVQGTLRSLNQAG